MVPSYPEGDIELVAKWVVSLDSKMQKNQINKALLKKYQQALDSVDRTSNQPDLPNNYKFLFYELQGLIYEAKGKHKKADQFIKDAVVLKGDDELLSRWGREIAQNLTPEHHFVNPLLTLVQFVLVAVWIGLLLKSQNVIWGLPDGFGSADEINAVGLAIVTLVPAIGIQAFKIHSTY